MNSPSRRSRRRPSGRWFNATGNSLVQEQLDPSWNPLQATKKCCQRFSNGLPSDDRKPRHSIGIDNGEEWLSKSLDELRALAVELKPPSGAQVRPRPFPPETRIWRDSLPTNPWLVGFRPIREDGIRSGQQ